MPIFDDSTTTSVGPEDVWMLLYDPSRFPEWSEGIASIDPGGPGNYTMYVDGYPDFPMPQALDVSQGDHRVTISCMVSDLVFQWHLEPIDDGTRISVHVEIPEAEAARLPMQRAMIAASLRNLAELAASDNSPQAQQLQPRE
jgi:uncharacterized protein YndB with AHSA1/START domain